MRIGVKPKDPVVDKGFRFVEQGITKLESSVDGKEKAMKEFNEAVKLGDLNDGEKAVAFVPKDSESSGSPATDEVRLYTRVKGKLYKLKFDDV